MNIQMRQEAPPPVSSLKLKLVTAEAEVAVLVRPRAAPSGRASAPPWRRPWPPAPASTARESLSVLLGELPTSAYGDPREKARCSTAKPPSWPAHSRVQP